MQKQRLRSGWGQNAIEKLSTLDKICIHLVVKDHICNVGGLQLFCSSSGSTSRLLLWVLHNKSVKRWKTQTLRKPCANPAQTLRTIKSCHKLLMLSVFCTHINHQPVSNVSTIAPFAYQIEPLCVPSHHTKPTGRSHILSQTKFLTLGFFLHHDL